VGAGLPPAQAASAQPPQLKRGGVQPNAMLALSQKERKYTGRVVIRIV